MVIGDVYAQKRKCYLRDIRMFDGCSAIISDHQLLIIGAYYSRKQVRKNSTEMLKF